MHISIEEMFDHRPHHTENRRFPHKYDPFEKSTIITLDDIENGFVERQQHRPDMHSTQTLQVDNGSCQGRALHFGVVIFPPVPLDRRLHSPDEVHEQLMSSISADQSIDVRDSKALIPDAVTIFVVAI